MCVRLKEKEITLHYLSAPAFPLPRTHLSFLVLIRASVGHKRNRNISTFLCLWEESAALLVLTQRKGANQVAKLELIDLQ